MVWPRPSRASPRRSNKLMVVSRKRSCWSSRACFFLYFATHFPLASPDSELRCFRCMINENVTLMASEKPCQAAVPSTLYGSFEQGCLEKQETHLTIVWNFFGNNPSRTGV